jgi:cystathionine beta-lyase
MASRRSGSRKLGTRLAHSGRDRKHTGGVVNPQVQRASTVLVEKAEDLYRPGVWTYGRHGTATHEALRAALSELEQARHCLLVPSGLLACTLPMLALATGGDHVLMTDNCYGPTRRFCERLFKRLGVETEFFDPTIGAAIAGKFRPNTKLIFIESPGSLTFEISDTPAICAGAKKAGVLTVFDNSWCAGVCHKPLELGADVSVQSTSKYVSGGADVLGGAIFTNDDKLNERIKEAGTDLGLAVSPDDAYMLLRGLRTLETRMSQCAATALDIAKWLEAQPQVDHVIHPALPGHAQHAIWKRDFSGASGLFGVVLKPAQPKQVHAFLDALELFGLGFSYGGFESLAINCDPQLKRTEAKPRFAGPLIRISIGLEDAADLKADLERGLAALGST